MILTQTRAEPRCSLSLNSSASSPCFRRNYAPRRKTEALVVMRPRARTCLGAGTPLRRSSADTPLPSACLMPLCSEGKVGTF